VGKVVVIPARPEPAKRTTPRVKDGRYIEGQRMLVEAIKYLVREDATANRDAISMLSEHFRTQFRMDDRPHPQ
jgi:hypothetical protein